MTNETTPETQVEEINTPVLEEAMSAADDLPELNAADAFKAIFEPFQDDLKDAGINELEACELLLNIHHELRANPKETIAWLADHYGVPLQAEEEIKAQREKAAALNMSSRGMRATSPSKGRTPRDTMAMIFDQVKG